MKGIANMELIRFGISINSEPGVENDKLATSVAGIIGTLVVFGFSYGIATLIKQRKS